MRTLIRRLAVPLVLGLLAAGTVLAASPRTAAGAAHAAIGGLANATPDQVKQELGVGQVPAAIVFIIDISGSMAAGPHSWNHDLYPEVLQDVPVYWGDLATQDPQDMVATVLLGNKSDTQVYYSLGPPQAATGLPPAPYSDESDFGYAFQQAVTVLSQAFPAIKVGQVLLFSDGEVNEPASDDPQYAAPSNNDFTGPGWQSLKAQVQGLEQRGMTIGAYAVPLGSRSATYTSDQDVALRQVFGANVMALPEGPKLTQTLTNDVNPRILDGKVASAAAPDNGAGVQVTWHGLPSARNSRLDFRTPGHLDATLTLTARTSKIPLYVSKLSVTLAGLPGSPDVSLPDELLEPAGRPVTLSVRLSWPGGVTDGSSVTGGTKVGHGTLTVRGTVLSPDTAALTGYFKDTGYSPGPLRGSTGIPLTAVVPVSAQLPTILAVVIIALALLIAVLVVRLLLTSAPGTLILSSVHGTRREIRARKARRPVRTLDLIGVPGTVTARGMSGGKVRVTIRPENGPMGSETFSPDDQKMVAGIWTEYHGRKRGTKGQSTLGSDSGTR